MFSNVKQALFASTGFGYQVIPEEMSLLLNTEKPLWAFITLLSHIHSLKHLRAGLHICLDV